MKARMNLTDVKEFGKRLLKKSHHWEQRTRTDPITVTRFALGELTGRVGLYQDIIRVSQVLFNVCAYRNPNNLSEGIYLLGRKSMVKAFEIWISHVVSRIEIDTLWYGNPIIRPRKKHGNRKLSSYRARKIKQVVKVAIDLELYLYEIQNAGVKFKEQLILVNAHKNFSVLNNKTKYNGSLRYSP